MQSAVLSHSVARPFAHPNDLDRKRIERSLQARKRYRYVTPQVVTTVGGYRIESPCCSRNIDKDGGVVDVALLLHDPDSARWELFRKATRPACGNSTPRMSGCPRHWSD